MRTFLGNIKGEKGDPGPEGPRGEKGEKGDIELGYVRRTTTSTGPGVLWTIPGIKPGAIITLTSGSGGRAYIAFSSNRLYELASVDNAGSSIYGGCTLSDGILEVACGRGGDTFALTIINPQ